MHIDELAAEMELLMSCLYDASIQHGMGGLGGCPEFEIEQFPHKFQKYIKHYVTGERNSSQCTLDFLYENHHLSDEVRS
jgi:hypothetical protein